MINQVIQSFFNFCRNRNIWECGVNRNSLINLLNIFVDNRFFRNAFCLLTNRSIDIRHFHSYNFSHILNRVKNILSILIIKNKFRTFFSKRTNLRGFNQTTRGGK
ncbi:hypothetical protein [Phage Phass-1]|uniref:Uncharacterized protein n=1 Tax=Phage Phass-1 TaxID=3043662 RepID=A0AAF0LZJ3_9CAUD|nr:hypothetical protein [Phage Phass-1]